MRLAFVGHSYHQVTGSSRFMLDLLARRFEVSTYWSESWLQGDELDLAPVVEGGFDAVVVWQVEAAAPRLARAGLPNVTFFPMFDGCHSLPDGYWRAMEGVKVLCFASSLHERLTRLGLRSRYAQYFPDPAGVVPVEHGPGLAGYLWQRQQDITWRTIRPLVGEADFRRFTLHRALDPSSGEFVAPTDEEVTRLGMRVTGWFPDRRAAQADLASHNVYFAPRLREGIGMSFLEAMAMGFLVVAPDRPTMSEYLVSGVNGLLYDPERPVPLDFGRAAELGARARRAVELGHAKWLRCSERLLDYVAAPTAACPIAAPLDALDPWSLGGGAGAPTGRTPRHGPPASPSAAPRREGGRRLANVPQAPRPGERAPAVTVAVVTRNAEATLRPTLDSILAQDWPSRELVVLDGASEDGTLEILREYDEAIDLWRSAADGGPYEAMNAAAHQAAGTYLIFMNAGDTFQATNSLSLALDGAPADADVIFGHHVYRHVAGHEEVHRAARFERTWADLREGSVGWTWLAGVPGHQATLTRTELLRRHPFRTELRIAADHDLLYRLAAQGARFHHAGQVLATYVGGGLSWRNRARCFAEWRRIALEHTANPAETGRRFAAMEVDFRRDELTRLSALELLRRAPADSGAREALGRLVRHRLARLVPRPLRPDRRIAVELGSARLGDALRSFTGLSHAEGWGRWTDGEEAVLVLDRPVRRATRLTIRLHHVFGPNVGRALVVQAGSRTWEHSLSDGEQVFTGRFRRVDRESVERIVLRVPAPASPQELGWGEDRRRLGVALTSIEIDSRP